MKTALLALALLATTWAQSIPRDLEFKNTVAEYTTYKGSAALAAEPDGSRSQTRRFHRRRCVVDWTRDGGYFKNLRISGEGESRGTKSPFL